METAVPPAALTSLAARVVAAVLHVADPEDLVVAASPDAALVPTVTALPNRPSRRLWIKRQSRPAPSRTTGGQLLLLRARVAAPAVALKCTTTSGPFLSVVSRIGIWSLGFASTSHGPLFTTSVPTNQCFGFFLTQALGTGLSLCNVCSRFCLG